MSSATAAVSHYPFQDIIDDVYRKYDEYLKNNTSKPIAASSSLLLWRLNSTSRKIEVLLGKVEKEVDPEEVNGALVNFGGRVQSKDFENNRRDGVIVALAREVKEEANGQIPEDKLMECLKTAQCVKNAQWAKVFCAANFVVQMDVPDEVVDNFYKNPSKEIRALEWVSLEEIVAAQAEKESDYQKMVIDAQTLCKRELSPKEKMDDPTLTKKFKQNIKLPSGKEVAHYVARTVVIAAPVIQEMSKK